jgi:hypothetical protein
MDASTVKKLLAGAALLGAAWLAYSDPPRPTDASAEDAEDVLDDASILDPADLVAVISRGERVDLQEHLEDGRYTVVAFGADW